MVLARRFANDVLLETGERAEWVDHAIVQIKLSLRDVPGVVRDGMGDIVARHGGHRQDGDRAGAAIATGPFIAHGQLTVQIPDVAPVGGHPLHRDADLFEGVGVGGHIGHQDQHPFVFLHREALCDL